MYTPWKTLHLQNTCLHNVLNVGESDLKSGIKYEILNNENISHVAPALMKLPVHHWHNGDVW
jgi:hypothetical protein